MILRSMCSSAYPLSCFTFECKNGAKVEHAAAIRVGDASGTNAGRSAAPKNRNKTLPNVGNTKKDTKQESSIKRITKRREAKRKAEM